jgi:hypothetical protein
LEAFNIEVPAEEETAEVAETEVVAEWKPNGFLKENGRGTDPKP